MQSFQRSSIVVVSQLVVLLQLHWFPSVRGASQCAKIAGCSNLERGDQERPVLGGDQKHRSSTGTCEYGHAGAKGECKTGAGCGLSLHECICLSKADAHQAGVGAKITRVGAGLVLMVLGITVVACYINMRRRRNTAAKVSPTRSTMGLVGQPIGAPTGAGADGRFAPICVQPATVIANAAQQDDEVEKAGCFKHLDCFTIMLVVVFPTMLGISGGGIFLTGVSMDPTQYFNGCRT
eukprot:gb/GFBE01019385.1/.p1 GENE.gb/GFBE01019385.1/~~gb/GFBE01019385.1/.p1  ORF type:complete len:236 (+),score=35.86 gb/GFBE01019385.1/:1-708(+)